MWRVVVNGGLCARRREVQTGCGDGPCPRVLVVNVDYAQAQELQERVGIDSRIDLRLLDAENARFAGLRILRCAQRPSRRTRTERLRTLPGMYCFPILWDSTPFCSSSPYAFGECLCLNPVGK